jgi:hypothetical protein
MQPAAWVNPAKERPIIDNEARLMDHLHDARCYSYRHRKLTRPADGSLGCT